MWGQPAGIGEEIPVVDHQDMQRRGVRLRIQLGSRGVKRLVRNGGVGLARPPLPRHGPHPARLSPRASSSLTRTTSRDRASA